MQSCQNLQCALSNPKAIIFFVPEKIKFQTNLNHFQLKAQISLKTLKVALGELPV